MENIKEIDNKIKKLSAEIEKLKTKKEQLVKEVKVNDWMELHYKFTTEDLEFFEKNHKPDIVKGLVEDSIVCECNENYLTYDIFSDLDFSDYEDGTTATIEMYCWVNGKPSLVEFSCVFKWVGDYSVRKNLPDNMTSAKILKTYDNWITHPRYTVSIKLQ